MCFKLMTNIINYLPSLATIVIAVVAVLVYRRWPKELTSSKVIECLADIYFNFELFKDTFQEFRYVIFKLPSQEEINAHAYEVGRILSGILVKINRLLQMYAVYSKFKNKSFLSKEVQQCNQLINDLETAYRLYDPNTGDLENIEYNLIKSSGDDDPLSVKLMELIECSKSLVEGEVSKLVR